MSESILDDDFRISREAFLKEETLCGYTVTAEMKKVFAKLLDILEIVQKICTKHNIPYVVSGGSLLGAVRHKGFIPWDDDIDIAMFREDYDRFVQIAQKELQSPLFLQTSLTDCRNIRYARVMDLSTSGILPYLRDYEVFCKQGVCVDIFPMDGIVASPLKFKLQQWCVNQCGMVYACAHLLAKPKGILKSVGKTVFKCIYKTFGHKRFHRFRENLFRKYSPDTCGKCGLISFFGHNPCSNVETAYFKDTVEVPFEYLKVRIPRDYDTVLRVQYGNWWEFKPGTQNHTGEIGFDLETPYLEKIREKFGEKPASLEH